jgi:HEPN/RES N-terminal domain 1
MRPSNSNGSCTSSPKASCSSQRAGWDGREGGYQVPTIETPDLLWEHEVTEDDKLLYDIAGTVNLELWCRKDPYAATDAEALRWGWAAFRKYVQHNRRYTFLTRDDSTADGAGAIPMHGIPAAVVEAVDDTGMITAFDAGTTWWRARVHNPGESYIAAKDIGTPADKYARDNRKSPKASARFTVPPHSSAPAPRSPGTPRRPPKRPSARSPSSPTWL